MARAEERIAFSVDEGPAEITLNELSRQAGLLHLIDPDRFHGVTTHAVHGALSIEAALRTLVAGTGITFKLSADHQRIDFDRVPTRTAKNVQNAQKAKPDAAPDGTRVWEGAAPEGTERASAVVVTGTHIHSSYPIGARVINMDAEELQDGGSTSVADFLRALPQSFGGGPSPDTHLGAEAAANSGMGTAINLRGLGAKATLILFNGERLAPSGSDASFTDLTNIPLCAIDRVEVLLDGAAATYGSDAIAGVVNIVTRDGTQPPASFAQWSSVGSGSEHTGTLYQTQTERWDSGNLIVALGSSHQTPLAADDRGFYTVDLRYGGGPNLNLPESYPPVLSALAGGSNWSLSRSTPAPQSSDFQLGVLTPADRYQDAQIIASQDNLNAFTRLFQSVNDVLSVSIDAIANRRRAAQITGPEPVDVPIFPGNPYYVDLLGNQSPFVLRTNLLGLLGPEATSVLVTVYDVSVNAEMTVGGSGMLRVALHHASEQESQHTVNVVNVAALETALQSPDPDLSFNPYDQALDHNPALLAAIRSERRYDSLSQLESLSVTLDGNVTTLPAGPLRGAVGVELRSQSFNTQLMENDVNFFSNARYKRLLAAAFAELTAPLVSLRADQHLDVSLSARRDQYSDFGGASTPRASLQWRWADGLKVYGSYGHSFRAPDLGDLDKSQNSTISVSLPDNSSQSGQSQALVLSGNNPALKQERATEGALGLTAHLSVSSQTALDIDLHYFDIRYQDRIATPPFSFELLNDSHSAYLVTRDPSAAQLQAACSSGRYLSPGQSCLGSNPAEIIDLRLRNLSELDTRGIDFDTRVTWDTRSGLLIWRTNGAYLLDYAQTASPGAQQVSLLNTQSNPINLRFTDSLDWRRGRLNASVSMNYTNGYQDVDSQPRRPIGSFITFDWRLKRTFGEPGAAGALDVTAGMQNALNRTPPFVANQLAAVGYDQENFDPQGRVWFLSLSRHW